MGSNLNPKSRGYVLSPMKISGVGCVFNGATSSWSQLEQYEWSPVGSPTAWTSQWEREEALETASGEGKQGGTDGKERWRWGPPYDPVNGHETIIKPESGAWLSQNCQPGHYLVMAADTLGWDESSFEVAVQEKVFELMAPLPIKQEGFHMPVSKNLSE